MTSKNGVAGMGHAATILPTIAADQRDHLLAAALSSIANAVVVTDLDGRIQWVNRAFTDISGYRADEAIGKNRIRLLRSGRHDDDFYEDQWSTILAGSIWRGEVIVRHKDARLYTVRETITPLAGEDGRTNHFLAVHEDVTQLRASQARLEHLATHDPVTGLPNRNLLFDRLGQARGSAQRSGRCFAVLYLGIDNFKLVNDGFGRETGDDVLRAVTSMLSRIVRPSDTVARHGGDEFVVLCPDADDELAAVAVATRIQTELHTPFTLNGMELLVSASIGIVVGDATADSSRLLRAADAAMHRAKDLGRNRIELYDAAMRRRARHRLDLATQLRKAIDNGGITAQYQPIVSLASGRIVGAEALARWRLANGQVITPEEFIPLAEDLGMIAPLGQRMLELACRDARPWTRATSGNFFVSVNVSPRQFNVHGFPAAVARVLTDTGLNPGCLHLEITESKLMNDIAVQTAIAEIGQLGCKFAIDDFGTGYSSLSYLRRMPADTLKIDRSFVSGLTTDLQDRALVTAAIELAHNFGLTAIAEGVQTDQQLLELTALGCDHAQGYFWTRPTDAETMTTFIDSPAASGRP